MINDYLNEILLWTLTLVAFWWFVTVNTRLALAELRHQLFKARGQLFDQSLELNVAFDSEAYGIARTTINGLIRFAHKLNLFQIIAILFSDKYLYEKKLSKSYENKMKKAIAKLTPEQQDMVNQVITEANKAIVIYIFKSSLLLTIIFMPIVIIAVVLMRLSKLKKLIVGSHAATTINAVVDAEANVIGHSLIRI